MRHIFKISILFILFCSAAKAEYSAAQAEEFYRSGDVKKAAEAYRALADQAHKEGSAPSADIYYNLGTALAKSGAAGEAYVMFWKAFFLRPLDADIRFNLALAESKLPETAKFTKPANWLFWWPQIALPIPYKLWLSIAMVFLAFFLLLGNTQQNSPIKNGLAICCLLFLLIGGLAYYQSNTHAAGLIAATKTRSGPEQSFPEISALEAGALVTLEEQRDGWYKIRFRGGENQETVGWVPSATVLEIN